MPSSDSRGSALQGEHLQRAVQRGGTAVFLAQVASQLLSLVALAIMLRTLGLEPYGLVGMVLPLLAFGRIFIYSGLDVAAIQHIEIDDQQASALFWMQQILGCVGSLLVAVCAPLVSHFYQQPELLSLTVVLSGTMLVTTLGVQHQALLQRQMRLVALSAIRVASQVVGSVVAVVAALAGAGVWTLVVLQYTELAATTALSWWATGWKPHFRLRGTASRHLVIFGGHYTLSSFLLYLMSNLDKILVGRFLGTQALALYGQAFNLAQKPLGLVVAPLTGVMLPALSHARVSPEQFRTYVGGFLRFLAWAMLPCGVGLALVADETMAILGGPQWRGAGPILGVFALMIPPQALFNVMGSLYASVGRADRMAQACVPVAIVSTLAFVVSLWLIRTHPQAVLILAWVYFLVFSLLIVPAYVAWAFHCTGLPLRLLWHSSRPALWGTLVMAVGVLFVHVALLTFQVTSPWLMLPAKMAVGIAVYLIATRTEFFHYLRAGWAGIRQEPTTSTIRGLPPLDCSS